MTRPLLWITAFAVALGAAVAAPAVVGADLVVPEATVDPMGIDGVVARRQLTVTGEASGILTDRVAVTVTPKDPMPAECPSRSGTTGVSNGRYQLTVDVACNGPYTVEAVASSGGVSGPKATQDVGVAEWPQPPSTAPDTQTTPDGGLTATWTPSADIDAAGWVLVAGASEVPLSPDTLSSAVPAANAGDMVALRSQRWGARGPGTDVLTSDLGASTMYVPPDPIDPQRPVDPPDPLDPGPTPPPGGGGGTPPPGTSPPTTSGGPPTRGTGSDATLPSGYTEELPYGAPDDAYVPEDRPRDPSAGDEESAAGTSPSAGLYRVSDEKSPGLVAPFALALLMITVAAHITWYLRRSKPTGGGQVTLH